MNPFKYPLTVGGTIAFLIIVALAWGYTETIKTKYEIESERIASEERIKQAEMEQKQNEIEVTRQQKQVQVEKEAAQEEQTPQPKPITGASALSPKQNQPEDPILKIERCKVLAQQLVDNDKTEELPTIMQIARESCAADPYHTDTCFVIKAAEITKMKEGIWEKSYQQYYGNCIN